jgi:hypothetical protein
VTIKLSINVGNLEFGLDLDTGLALLAGPNGVGKSYIFQSIAGQRSAFHTNTRFGTHLQDQIGLERVVQINGAKVQDLSREVLLVNHGSLSSASISLAGPSKEAEDIGGWARSVADSPDSDALIASHANALEREEIARAPNQKGKLVERILYRSQPIPLQEINKAFSQYHWEYAKFTYEQKSLREIEELLGEPPGKNLMRH